LKIEIEVKEIKIKLVSNLIKLEITMLRGNNSRKINLSKFGIGTKSIRSSC
jgi:hypothetical protein